MILSLVRVYFHYIFIYFHTRTILPIRIWAESFFPSRRYLSFVNRSRKICIHFHPSFSHIINRRIFVDRFCSHITFPKKILLDLDPISIYVDRTSLTGLSNTIPRSQIAWSWHNFARVRSEKEKKDPAKRKERERERETVSISIFWKTGLACLHESNFHATDLTACACPITFANYLSRD